MGGRIGGEVASGYGITTSHNEHFMSGKFETLTDSQKALVDARIFVRECHRRQNISSKLLNEEKYKESFAKRDLMKAREQLAEKYLDVERSVGEKFKDRYETSQDFFIKETHSILGLGLTHRATGKRMDVSDLLLMLDCLPEPNLLERPAFRAR